ncbi:MAG: DUF92 domain-containing protein [Rubricoccaceae bacterium]
MPTLLAFGLFSAILLAAVGVGEALRAWAGWAAESSRRIVHVGAGLATALCPPLFSQPGPIYALAGLFIVANVVAVRRRLLPGMHAIERESWGTVTFPIALVVALWLCWTLDASRVFILQIAFGVLALADPAASLAGTRLAKPRCYTVAGQTKSLAGSLAFFLVASSVTALGLAALASSWSVGAVAVGALSVGGVGAAAEALGRKGWDNLWIVLATIVPLVHLHHQPGAVGAMALGLGLAAAFGVVAYRARSLDLSGTLAASILAWMVAALGGLAWVVPAFTFFVLSSALSRMGRRRKADAEVLAEKGSRRDAGQVVANGGVGAVLLAAHVFVPDPVLYWAFVGSFAAAAADTWGTEIGTFFRRPTRLLAVGPRVPSGTSGGMSVPGTIGSALGAAVVVASAFLVGASVEPVRQLELAILVAGGGGLAALLDSALGATVQARYRLPDGTLTERSTSSTGPLELAKGVRWMDNDGVNLACTLFGGLWPMLWLG